MNAYEITQKVNDRLYDGNESKFSSTFIVVSRILRITKHINHYEHITQIMVSGSDADEYIIELINALNENNNHLNFKNFLKLMSIYFWKLEVLKILAIDILTYGLYYWFL